MDKDPDGFREFVAARSGQLLRSAWLLTGDWQHAEDLVQTTLVKALPRWHRIQQRDHPELYVRKILLTTYLSWRRRRSHSEIPLAPLPDAVTAARDADLHADLVTAIRALPARQRAVITLRYFDDLTEADTATVLGCGIGTVKSHTARALATLRISPTLTAAYPEEQTL